MNIRTALIILTVLTLGCEPYEEPDRGERYCETLPADQYCPAHEYCAVCFDDGSCDSGTWTALDGTGRTYCDSDACVEALVYETCDFY